MIFSSSTAVYLSTQIRKTSLLLLLSVAALEVALTLLYYPRTVDGLSPTEPASTRAGYRAFYEDAYSPARTIIDPALDSPYPGKDAPTNAPPPRDGEVAEIQAFVERYHLHAKRVLEVGAGSGKLQDLVEDYTGLDIASTARRFFHKPFVAASATHLPFPDNAFDALWTINVLEHVPTPELALREMRRVLNNGGLLYLAPAWQCRSWHAAGYAVRPYRDFPLRGKLIKASIPLRDSVGFRSLYTFPIRGLRLLAWLWEGQPTSFRYTALTPNYTRYWEPDGDAVNSMDPYEAILWFVSRGDRCLNYPGALSQFFVRTNALVIQIRK